MQAAAEGSQVCLICSPGARGLFQRLGFRAIAEAKVVEGYLLTAMVSYTDLGLHPQSF